MHLISKRVDDYPCEIKQAIGLRTDEPARDFKVQIELDDRNRIEASVFSVFSKTGVEKHACISTQAGCKFGCKFCISGRNGYKRNLTDTEILQKITLLINEESTGQLDYITYMGIGEPLDNFDNVVRSIVKLQDRDNSYENKVGLATCGISDRLSQLANTPIRLNMLWVSLHASTNKKRGQIMPVTKMFPIEGVINSAEEYALKTETKVWLNYLIYKGFNNTDEDILNLIKILRGKENTLGLMLTTPNFDLLKYKKASLKDVILFGEQLRNVGLQNTISAFSPLGNTVGARCGEFVFTPNGGLLSSSSSE